MADLILTAPDIDPDAELRRLARRHAAAGNVGIALLNAVGGQVEGMLDRLPRDVQTQLGRLTETALTQALGAASLTRRVVPDQPVWMNRAACTAMGAAGGFGGLPTALAELPLTVTMLLRVIEGVAAEHGFDPSSESVRFDCVEVFSAAGPLARDDGSEIGFLSARVALSGAAMQALISRVAPRLAAALGQKLAAQTVPVLGAAAGAVTNLAYVNYYTDMAHVHFGVRRLAIETDIPQDEVLARLRSEIASTRSARSRAGT